MYDARVFAECCGSTHWRALIRAGAPYDSEAALIATSDAAFDQLDHDDWLEAFSAHATIGVVRSGAANDAREQAGMSGAGAALRLELAAANVEYQARFGHVFLIRASGRGGEEMLAALRERMDNPPETEFAIACGQEREIVTLRLQAAASADADADAGAAA